MSSALLSNSRSGFNIHMAPNLVNPLGGLGAKVTVMTYWEGSDLLVHVQQNLSDKKGRRGISITAGGPAASFPYRIHLSGTRMRGFSDDGIPLFGGIRPSRITALMANRIGERGWHFTLEGLQRVYTQNLPFSPVKGEVAQVLSGMDTNLAELTKAVRAFNNLMGYAELQEQITVEWDVLEHRLIVKRIVQEELS